MTAAAPFLTRDLPLVGRPVCRLGLAFNYGLDERGTDAALERAPNYLFVTAMRTSGARKAIKRALARDRERYLVATGPTVGYFGATLRHGAEKWLRELGIERLDVFHLFWLGVASALTDGTLEAMQQLKAEGKVGAFAVSIHDRPRAGKLAAEGPIDLLMFRYNAAHPGAERDIFPCLERRRPAMVAYTATSHRKLLSAPRGWSGPRMTAADCYRFCLSSPHVDVVLTAPGSVAELDETLAGLAKGPLSAEEEAWMRDYGAKVHG